MTGVAYDDAEWLTSKQVAVIAGVRPPTVRAWIHRGYGPPYYKIMRSVRYRRSEVEAWLQEARHEPKKKSA